MDLQIIHDTLRFYIDKFQNGWYTPEELDSMVDRAQMQEFGKLLVTYALNQQVQDDLLPFKAEYGFNNGTTVGGFINANSDYQALIAVETVIVDDGHTIYCPVEILNEAQISYRKSSQLTAPTSKYPVGILQPSGVQLYPAVPAAGTVYYFRRPVAPVFVYTSAGRVITYDQGTSVQLEWDDGMCEKIIFKALQLLGINLQATEVFQVADAMEKSIP